MGNTEKNILIVAECNVNFEYSLFPYLSNFILIVAECNVNGSVKGKKFAELLILIVAECNVNFYSVRK